MCSPLIFLLVVGLTTAENAWKPGYEYTYQIEGRTLAALHQVADTYVGVVSRATITLQPQDSGAVLARISDAQYSPVQASLPEGWASRIPEKEHIYRTLPLSGMPFQIIFKNGVVDKLVVSKELSNPEVNLIKSVVSQLQVDIRRENEMKWIHASQTPKTTSESIYSTMEDTVTGKCEVMYDIAPLPMYAIQGNGELVPFPEFRGDGQLYDIMKTKNFTNCEKRVTYHYGFTGLTDWKPADNQMGQFFSRSAVSRVVISGSPKDYIIQSSVTVNKIVLSPALYNAQKGMVASRMKVTLRSRRPSSGHPPSVPNPHQIKDLVYDYNDPYATYFSNGSEKGSAEGNAQKSFQYQNKMNAHSSGEGNSEDSKINSQEIGSSSSHSSEDINGAGLKRSIPKRIRRSMPPKNKKASSESRISDDKSSKDDGGFSSRSSGSSFSFSKGNNPMPRMNEAPKTPLLPYFIGNQGRAVHTSKDIDPINTATKLCSQISSELQDPNNIPQKGTLSKFIILVRLVRTMSAEQLRKATSYIYAPIKTYEENPWTVFRDAVAAAGTGPCLIAIKEWIDSKKIVHEEAAEIVVTLASSARTPTEEFLKTLFNLATSPEVTKQPFLNTTSILSFANLVRKAQVSNAISQSLFPIHVYGRLSPINPKVITEEYIPYLAKQLHSAVKDGDSHKIQVYIRTLGNLGHPKILSIFEPYLEGRKPMSTFQRTLMVTSLNKFAQVFPQIARRILFNVYQNLGEAHEVRCAAFIVLMRTDPPAFMLQRMAEFTNRDPSLHVTALIKSSIQSAANLKGPHHYQLKMNAQAAVNLLNPRPLSIHYSRQFLKSYVVKEMGLAYRQEFSWIGSSDGLLPSSAFITTRFNMGGWRSQYMSLASMTSSINDLAHSISDLFHDPEASGRGSAKHTGRPVNRTKRSPESGSHSPFTTEKIVEMLNIEPSDYKQVEGNLLVRYMGAHRFFTYDNTTINSLPSLLKSAANALHSGYKVNYNKLYNQFAMTMAFPTETGFPFVYSMKIPTYISLTGQVQARTQPDMGIGARNFIRVPQTVSSTASLQWVYSSHMTAKISFVDPLTHSRYIAGVQKNIQINLPIKASVNIDCESSEASITLQPLDSSHDAQVFHYSTTPYTAKHNILELVPVSQGSNYQPIHVRKPIQMDANVGKDTTGFAFRLKYSTEQAYLDYGWLYEKAQRHNAISIYLYPWAEKTIKCNNISVFFDSHRSSSKSVTIKASYEFFTDTTSSNTMASSSDEDSDNIWSSSYDSNEIYEPDTESNESSISECKAESSSKSNETRYSRSSMTNLATSKPIGEERQLEFLRRATSRIKDSFASVIDLHVEFDGSKNITYVVTAAYASSKVDETTRALLYFYKSSTNENSKTYEVCAVATGKYSKVPLMNFSNALKADPTSHMSSEITFGEKCGSGASQIRISATAEQSHERKEYIRRNPMAQECISLLKSGSYLQPACRNLTASTNFLDSYTINVQYEKLPDILKNITHKAYSMAKYIGYPYLDENTFNVKNKESRISIDVDFKPNLEAVNVSLSAPALVADFNLVRVNQWVRPFVVHHPTWSAADRFLTTALHGQWTASCGLNRATVNTFDNNAYPIILGKCWYVMMIAQPKGGDSSSSSSNVDPRSVVTILARDYSSSEKELKIILGDDVFDLKPSDPFGSKRPYESKEANGNVFHNGNQHGVCEQHISKAGDFEGETLAFWYPLPSGEVVFEAPQHDLAIIYNGEAAWIEAGSNYRSNIIGLCGNYDGEPANDYMSPKGCNLQDPKMFVANWAVPDQSCAGGAKEMQRQAASAPCYKQTVSPNDNPRHGYNSNCIHQRTKIVERGNLICFSIRPLLTCADNCRITEKMERSVPVHCVSSSEASRHFVEMAKKGANPDFSHKEPTNTIKVNVPLSCTSEL